MSLLVPAALYVLALAIRLAAANEIPFPATEPSAYYVDVARNLVAGHGLVADSVWSYATPPLEVPKPAFELWLPMSTFVSGAAMAFLGSSYWAAQIGSALLGAAVAPLAWAVGREAALTHGLGRRRGGAVAITSGLLAAILGPLVLAAAVPDSTTPFTVFMLLAALLIPPAIGVRRDALADCDGVVPAAASARPASGASARPASVAGFALGIVLGLAYLSRMEVIWLGLTVLLMLAGVVRSEIRSDRPRAYLRRLWPVVAGGLVIVVPWLLRNQVTFGSPFPGQAIENLFLVENSDIFAFGDRPDAATYLGQGLATVLSNPVAASWHSLVDVLVVPAFPVALVGLATLPVLRRSPALRRPTALAALLASGALIFVSTMLLFPVATLWGTFLHAAGPLLVALGVVAALGADAFMARVSELRGWGRPNVILAPVALVGTASVLTALQVSILSDQARTTEARYAGVAAALEHVVTSTDVRPPPTFITDHPVWLADAVGGFAIALPDEDLDAIARLGDHFGTGWVVVMDERGRYPAALLEPEARRCLAEAPRRLEAGDRPAWLFRLGEACPPA